MPASAESYQLILCCFGWLELRPSASVRRNSWRARFFPASIPAPKDLSLYLVRHFFRNAAPQANRSSAIRAVPAG